MTGVFASSATVGAILGAGGLVVYINCIYNAQNDAELILKVIKENDNVLKYWLLNFNYTHRKYNTKIKREQSRNYY